ncbi:hypothetical protein GEMRC1_007292 [Eukaryota sp. GEM-RC1]
MEVVKDVLQPGGSVSFGHWLSSIAQGASSHHQNSTDYVSVDVIAHLHSLNTFFSATSISSTACELQSIVDLFQQKAELVNLLPLGDRSLDGVVPIAVIQSFGTLYADSLVKTFKDLRIELPNDSVYKDFDQLSEESVEESADVSECLFDSE